MKEKKVEKVFHIYFANNNFFLALTMEDNPGMWTEVLPVLKVNIIRQNEIALGLDLLYSLSEQELITHQFDGENGWLWNHAIAYWSIQWFTDGSVRILPQKKLVWKSPSGQEKDQVWEPFPLTDAILVETETTFDQVADLLTQDKLRRGIKG